MKKTKLAVIVSSSALCMTALAAVVVYDNVSVEGYSSSGTNGLVDWGSLAVGVDNDAFDRSASIGVNNKAQLISHASGGFNKVGRIGFGFGAWNLVNHIPIPDANGDPTIGYYGEESNSCTEMIGFAAGRYNEVYATNASTMGEYNLVTGDRGMAFGYQLLNSNDDATVVGAYNEEVVDAIFSVGNGDSSARSNALVVKKDGSITITEVQGDISMGVFSQ